MPLSASLPSQWSTRGLPPGESFAYWCEVIGQALPRVSAEGPGAGFAGTLSLVQKRSSRVIRFRSEGAHRVARSRRMAGQEEDGWMVSLQLRGEVEVCHGTGGAERRFCLRPGDIGILGTGAEMEMTFAPKVERVVAMLPAAALRALCPWAGGRGAFHLPRGGALVPAMTAILQGLAQQTGAEEADALERALYGCLSGAGQVRDASQDLRTRILRLIEDRLADPELSPEQAAVALGVSERSLHAALAGQGATFRRRLIERRLDRAAEALRDPAWAGARVSDVAWATGFSDLSHFSRRFADRFGQNPSGWRNGGKASENS